ncbi:hypothetical protein H072_11241 [Dactylellina haptotyla CBS 200.50]|uniref:F-box domain-containing protein n=1 Tax=Dactylellina haptotyla (strain CBS 200.50) TaxID=1284197 RepID=S7ZY85_DACHA|nr:hypothetical protein H072_11241 [Dactylellina haptotyla CBS 200.50]
MEPAPKPALLSLPLELLEAISKDLDEDDLLALRMTCNLLNTKARELHLDSIYNRRRVYFVPTSIENLLKIADSDMNTRVRQIVISSVTPYEFDPLDRETMDEKNWNIAEQALNVIHSEESYQFVESESRRLAEFDEAGPSLSMAFSKLPNLRTIEFERIPMDSSTGFQDFKRSELNLFYPAIGLSPGSRMVRGLEGESIFRPCWQVYEDPRFIPVVLYAAKLSDFPHLEIIKDCPPSRGIPLKWFNISSKTRAAYHRSFRNLRTLELTINYEKELSAGGGLMPYRTIQLNKLFCEWLEGFGSNLKTLRLYIFEQNGPAPMPFDLPTETGLPNLKSFILSSSVMSFENITKFLGHCKANLEVLKFSDCLFGDPNEDWFQLLQYLKRDFTKLQHFSYILFENYDAYKWIDDLSYVVPTCLTINGSLKKEKTECDIILGSRVISPNTYLGWRIEDKKFISAELEAHSDAAGFWGSMTEGSNSAETRAWHNHRFSYQRRRMNASY